jgi:iron complex transport system substrate-binding protein
MSRWCSNQLSYAPVSLSRKYSMLMACFDWQKLVALLEKMRSDRSVQRKLPSLQVHNARVTTTPRKPMHNALQFIAAYALFIWPSLSFSQNVAVLDDAGTRVTLAQPAKRIITLAPNLAELVYAAGAGSQMVAASRYSDYPDAVKKLPLVGDAFALNLERIATLKPDLVLVWHSGTPERQRSALKALAKRRGFAVFESEIRSVEDIASSLERIGQLSATPTEANAQAAQVRAQWQALSAQYAQAAPVRVFYQVWGAPLMTFNGQHIVSQAIRMCGGVQGFDNLAALTPTVGREAVLAFNPQSILSGAEAGNTLTAWKKFPHLAAVQQAQLQAVDAALLTRMGPRFVQAAASLCQTIARARPGR